MKPPKQIAVGPNIYRVKRGHKQRIETEERLGGRLSGACHHQRCEIVLSKGDDVQYERVTVLHETLHAAWYLCGLDAEKDEAEEDRVNRLAPVLLDVLRRNPKLLAYLVAEEECCDVD